MKQFNLEEYLKNPSKKVVTRDGRKARIICIDAESNYPIIALIKSTNGSDEYPLRYTVKGEYYPGHEQKEDLFFASEKHEGWINIYKRSSNNDYYPSQIYQIKEDAEKDGREWNNYIKTIKIEWEE